MKPLLDVTRFNHPLLVILSLPFTVIALALMVLFVPFAWLAMIIGRRPVFRLLVRLKEVM